MGYRQNRIIIGGSYWLYIGGCEEPKLCWVNSPSGHDQEGRSVVATYEVNIEATRATASETNLYESRKEAYAKWVDRLQRQHEQQGDIVQAARIKLEQITD